MCFYFTFFLIDEIAKSSEAPNPQYTTSIWENPPGATFGPNGRNFVSAHFDLCDDKSQLPPFAPPPPPVFKNLTQPDEVETLSSMLMSWYMSGYHTGCYVTMVCSSSLIHCVYVESDAQTKQFK